MDKTIEEVGALSVSYTHLDVYKRQALYRKFRPQEFEDVKGQEHIVTTLKNQIKADRIGHAYSVSFYLVFQCCYNVFLSLYVLELL